MEFYDEVLFDRKYYLYYSLRAYCRRPHRWAVHGSAARPRPSAPPRSEISHRINGSRARALRRLPAPSMLLSRPSIPAVLHAPASAIPAPRVVPVLGNLAVPPKILPRPAPKPPLPPTQIGARGPPTVL